MCIIWGLHFRRRGGIQCWGSSRVFSTKRSLFQSCPRGGCSCLKMGRSVGRRRRTWVRMLSSFESESLGTSTPRKKSMSCVSERRGGTRRIPNRTKKYFLAQLAKQPKTMGCFLFVKNYRRIKWHLFVYRVSTRLQLGKKVFLFCDGNSAWRAVLRGSHQEVSGARVFFREFAFPLHGISFCQNRKQRM